MDIESDSNKQYTRSRWELLDLEGFEMFQDKAFKCWLSREPNMKGRVVRLPSKVHISYVFFQNSQKNVRILFQLVLRYVKKTLYF